MRAGSPGSRDWHGRRTARWWGPGPQRGRKERSRSSSIRGHPLRLRSFMEGVHQFEQVEVRLGFVEATVQETVHVDGGRAVHAKHGDRVLVGGVDLLRSEERRVGKE